MAATCRGSQALQVPVLRTPEDSSFTKWQAYEESNAMEAAQITDSGPIAQIPDFGHTGFPKTIVFIFVISLL